MLDFRGVVAKWAHAGACEAMESLPRFIGHGAFASHAWAHFATASRRWKLTLEKLKLTGKHRLQILSLRKSRMNRMIRPLRALLHHTQLATGAHRGLLHGGDQLRA